ncbi:sensor histidine kinase [Pedobacter antarcticus]|uniref:sensor histidine kinase n=1 Tax=Pedobacter antarcticus TaxID=34086 RepID=UPI002930E993|nr:histidine kinase [Pedobacter antarcticus]
MKPIALLVLFLSTSISCVHGQHIKNKSHSYIRIETPGLPGSQLQEKVQGGNVSIVTAGAWVEIHTTNYFKAVSDRIEYRAYYKNSDLQHNNSQDITFRVDSQSVYLYPGVEFCIDLLERKTGNLITRYHINRPKLIPEVKFYHQNENSESPFYNLSQTDSPEKLRMAPGRISIGISSRPDFNDLEVEYVLVNQKTRTRQSGISKTRFDSLKLEANTVYELRLNYVVQKESVGLSYLYVQPYWYQSPKTYITLSFLLLIAGLAVLALFFKNRLKSSKKKQQKLEDAAIRLQSLLNPHFTFNALSTIQGLMNTDRIDEANQYLQEFSELLRNTLTKSQRIFTNLDQELEMMRIYIRLEALRFNFSWNIEIDAELNPSEIEIPTLLLQPLIENAIKHGLTRLGNQGKLLITCKEGSKKNTFVITVKDNGTWIEKGDKADSYGLSLTAARIAAINNMKKGQKIFLKFHKQPGTEVVLTFHNWTNN